jgi:hypothetical protein
MINKILLSILLCSIPLVGGTIEVSADSTPTTQDSAPALTPANEQELQRHQPYLQDQIRLEHEAAAEAQWGAPH